MLESVRAIETQVQLALYTAGNAIAKTGAVRMLALPHAITAGDWLYINRKTLLQVSQK